MREPGRAWNDGGDKGALGGLHSDRCQSKGSPRTRTIPLKGWRMAGSEHGATRVITRSAAARKSDFVEGALLDL